MNVQDIKMTTSRQRTAKLRFWYYEQPNGHYWHEMQREQRQAIEMA